MKKLHALIALVLVLTAGTALADPPGWRVRVLTRGAEVQGTNGLAVGADGRLYVGSVVSRQIVVMDPRTGAVVDRLGSEIGVETPDDVAFGPDGSLYWTSIFTGEVGRRRPDGTASTIAQLPPGANPIAFDGQGRLFVGLAAFGDALYELDPDGVAAPRLVLDQPGGLNGFAFGADGLLYSPLTAAGAVVRIDVDAATVETVATGFPDPVAVDFDSHGRLYVADSASGEITRLDVATGAREVFVALRPGLDNLAFDPQDRLYVTSVHDGSVESVRPDGKVRTVSAGGMITAGGIATLPLGAHGGRDEVWVADFFTLRSFDGQSGRPGAVERSVFDTSALTAPHTVAADGGRLLLTSWLFNNVQVFDPATGEISLDVRDFALPLNAIRFQGDLVVAELLSGSVVRADGADPSQRAALATLAVPSGLAAAGDDLWAADWATGLVLQLVDAGGVLAPPRVVASGLANPEGLAVLPGGDLAVVESGAGRVSRIDPATGAVSTIADGLGLGAAPPPLVPPTWIFNGLAVGERGELYVTGDVANVVYELRDVEPR